MPCFSQFHYSDQEQNIQNRILDLTWNNTHSIENNSTNGIRFWLHGYQAFIFQITSPARLSNDSTLQVIQKMEQHIFELDSESPYFHYCLADLCLMQSYLYFLDDELLAALTAFWKAKRHYSSNTEKFPGFLPNQKHQFIDKAVMDRLNDVFANKKETTQPIGENSLTSFWHATLLKSAQDLALNREIKLLGFLVEASFDGNPTIVGSNELDEILHDTSKGPLESFAIQMALKKNEHYIKQLQVLSQADSLGFNQRLNILNLYLGVAYLNQINPRAEMYLREFLKHQQKENLVAYAQLKLSWFYLLNDKMEFQNCLQKINDVSNLRTLEDKQAKYEIVHASGWNQGLIKSRLLFDGGDYRQSVTELLKMKHELPMLSKGQKLEYAYRLARSYDKLCDYGKAVKFYQMVVNSEPQSEFYYPAYAAYYLAGVYLKLNKPDEAKVYFNACLQKDSPIYKSAIHRKAKESLRQLN